jgi:hypothetical protein
MSFEQKLYEATQDTLESELTKEQYMQLQRDLVNGDKDKQWISYYSQYIYEIFAILIDLKVDLTRERVKYFESKGLSLNHPMAFPSNPSVTTYPLLKAIEFRNLSNVRIMLGERADATLKDSEGYNSLELALLGSGIADREKVFECERLVYTIGEFIVIEDELSLSRWIAEDCCQKYMEESKYLNDVIRLCCPDLDDPPSIL